MQIKLWTSDSFHVCACIFDVDNQDILEKSGKINERTDFSHTIDSKMCLNTFFGQNICVLCKQHAILGKYHNFLYILG